MSDPDHGIELARRIDAAQTLEAIEAIMPEVQAWMEAHPNDRFDPSRPVWAAGYKLQRREDILREDV
jgi:proline racemase